MAGFSGPYMTQRDAVSSKFVPNVELIMVSTTGCKWAIAFCGALPIYTSCRFVPHFAKPLGLKPAI